MWHYYVLLLQAAAETTDHNSTLQRIAMECKASRNVTQEELEKLKSGNLGDEASKDLKCFSNCVLEKAKFIVDGKAQLENIQKTLTAHQGADFAGKLVAKCGTVSGSDPCDVAYKLTNCYYKYLQEKPAKAPQA